MKKLSIFFILALITVKVLAQQPCKVIRPGMNRAEVLKLIGLPGDTVGLGADVINNKKLPLVLWNYGNQQVVFSGEKVERVKADTKKENELGQQLLNGKISKKEFNKQIEKTNAEACK